jgi:hypothetical protein
VPGWIVVPACNTALVVPCSIFTGFRTFHEPLGSFWNEPQGALPLFAKATDPAAKTASNDEMKTIFNMGSPQRYRMLRFMAVNCKPPAGVQSINAGFEAAHTRSDRRVKPGAFSETVEHLAGEEFLARPRIRSPRRHWANLIGSLGTAAAGGAQFCVRGAAGTVDWVSLWCSELGRSRIVVGCTIQSRQADRFITTGLERVFLEEAMERSRSALAAGIIVAPIIVLLSGSPAGALSLELAQKCRAMAVKAHPPPAHLGGKAYAQAERDFYAKCVSKNGQMDNEAAETPPQDK